MNDVARAKRRAFIASIVRTVVISAAVIVGSLVTGDAAGLGGGIAPFIGFFFILWSSVFVAYLVWQLRAIRRSEFPGLRAMETLITGGVILLAAFAKAYLVIDIAQPGSFSEPLDHFTSYYFTVTILGTVGFGDITPVSVTARSVAMVQMLVDLALIAVFVRLVVGAVQASRSRHSS